MSGKNKESKKKQQNTPGHLLLKVSYDTCEGYYIFKWFTIYMYNNIQSDKC